jgi:hypothetical protein
MVKADIADAVLVLPALGIRLPDPETRFAVRPADRVFLFVEHLEAHEREQPAVESFGSLEVTDPD